MATTTSPVRDDRNGRRAPSLRRSQARAGYAFSALYVVLLAAFGLGPAFYAIYLAFVRPQGGFAFLDNFATVIGDFRYTQTFINLGLYTLAYLVPTMIISVGLALLLHARRPMVASTFRILYYLPHSVIGVAAVLLWLFMLTPALSPVGGLLRSMGYENLFQVISPSRPGSLAILLALIAVWTSGNGILLMFAALSSISKEVEEAAIIDGANAAQMTWYIKLPLLRKWVAYLLIINVGVSTQLFAEPQMLSAVTNGAVGDTWSPLQLAATFSWQYVNFPASAALAIQLLFIGIIAAVLIVTKVRLFRVEI